MFTLSEIYLTFEIRRRQDELERIDRESAPYEHPYIERAHRAAALMKQLRKAWRPAEPVAPSERDTRELTAICLNC